MGSPLGSQKFSSMFLSVDCFCVSPNVCHFWLVAKDWGINSTHCFSSKIYVLNLKPSQTIWTPLSMLNQHGKGKQIIVSLFVMNSHFRKVVLVRCLILTMTPLFFYVSLWTMPASNFQLCSVSHDFLNHSHLYSTLPKTMTIRAWIPLLFPFDLSVFV